MTKKGKKNQNLSKVDILIDKLDKIFTELCLETEVVWVDEDEETTYGVYFPKQKKK